MHVFSEAQRVYDFKDACLLTPLKAFKKLGELMNDSHESCRDMYDCSCVELDDLTEVCRKSGAYGSRLTGNTKIRIILKELNRGKAFYSLKTPEPNY